MGFPSYNMSLVSIEYHKAVKMIDPMDIYYEQHVPFQEHKQPSNHDRKGLANLCLENRAICMPEVDLRLS